MNEDINKDILKKIEESSQPDNIKDFLKEVLDVEYEHVDVERPQLKKPYDNLINKYKG